MQLRNWRTSACCTHVLCALASFCPHQCCLLGMPFSKDLRVQLRHLQKYILTCREEELKIKFMKKLPQPHIYETVHEYSLVVGALHSVFTSGGCITFSIH